MKLSRCENRINRLLGVCAALLFSQMLLQSNAYCQELTIEPVPHCYRSDQYVNKQVAAECRGEDQALEYSGDGGFNDPSGLFCEISRNIVDGAEEEVSVLRKIVSYSRRRLNNDVLTGKLEVALEKSSRTADILTFQAFFPPLPQNIKKEHREAGSASLYTCFVISCETDPDQKNCQLIDNQRRRRKVAAALSKIHKNTLHAIRLAKQASNGGNAKAKFALLKKRANQAYQQSREILIKLYPEQVAVSWIITKK